MASFTPFALEEFMSRFEQDVDYNLTESGVHPVTLGELLDLAGTDPSALLGIDLNYPHVNGIPALRERIADLYGATPDEVLVTVGAIEANYAATRALVGPRDAIAVMIPNYLQIWGVARNHRADLRTFTLDPGRDWALDLDGLRAAAEPGARLIAVCNPNNPTGRTMTAEEMDAVAEAADRSGAWILADEVYRGAERVEDAETPSFWGRHERVIAVGSMSKAYGLPGLRIGWAVAPADVVEQMWRHHEYTTISASMLANHLAVLALAPDVRARLLERTRSYIRRGYPVLAAWMEEHPGLLSGRPPDAAAIAFVRYGLDIGSEELAERIRREHGVLVVPGAHFGVERHLRISFGLPPDYLTSALDRVGDLLEEAR
jgi:aspartate/methionine/tyrosine aminotransferase